jgi:hypothetical protein
MQQVFSVAASSSGRANVPYDESLEAKNRDACKIMAEYYNNALKKNSKKGHFVFLSASS